MELFDELHDEGIRQEPLGEGAVVLRHFALDGDEALVSAVNAIAEQAPFRHMITPGGFRMSVAMTNCGDLGWVSDASGYRYSAVDPLTEQPWPGMPECFRLLAGRAAEAGGFAAFQPDACLINRYEPGARLTPHQDKDEQDYTQPIVSVSLGLPAVFQFGGRKRSDPLMRTSLFHGDTVVWGGPARLRYHGVLTLKPGIHRLTGAFRINLTFRKAVK